MLAAVIARHYKPPMPRRILHSSFILLHLLLIAAAAPSRDDVLNETLLPHTGPSVKGVDTGTLRHKLVVGYQGWFNAENDGSGRGHTHWTRDGRIPGPDNIRVDLWPDLSEYTPGERFPTHFKHRDGRPAEIFSSFQQKTIHRHFEWMRDYGIDAAFMQRFIVDLKSPRGLRHNNTVLANARAAANATGRAYVVMYDLSGLGRGRIQEVIDDWTLLTTRMKITADPAYLRHKGKPLVAVWGVGFNDNRQYTLAECRRLVEFLKKDCTVMLGVPTYWRELKNDTLDDAALHEIIQIADVVSPWTVGRYRTLPEVKRYAERTMAADITWCTEKKLDYLPVIFPGFSWHNMNPRAPLGQIPRQKGQLLWTQAASAKKAGATMAYIAMFDEVDEGTAIFKCTNDVPAIDPVRFVTYEGLPSDHYLKLAGRIGRLLRNEVRPTDEMPE